MPMFNMRGARRPMQPEMAGGVIDPQPAQPQGIFGQAFGGLGRFNERNPMMLAALGRVISGDDPYPVIQAGMAIKKDRRAEQKMTAQENATKALAKRMGYADDEIEAYAAAGRLGDLMKPDNSAKIREGLLAKGVPEAEVDGIIAAGAADQYFKPPEGGDDALTSNIKEYQYAVQNGMFNGSFTDWQTKGVKDQDPNFIRERDLRASYEGLDVVKGYNKMRDSYERIRASAASDSGPGDIGLIFNYMKMLDPGSVVRENEFATASNSGGVDASVRNLYNSLINGERLTPEQRQQFIGAADSLYSEASQNLGDTNERYTGIATDWKLEPNRIVVQPEKYEPLQIGQKRKMPDGVTIERVPDNTMLGAP